MKSKVFTTAWNLYRTARASFPTFSDALRYAWKRVKLVAKLRTGSVSFTFRKKDGSERPAVGTLDSSRYSYTRKTTGERPTRTDVVRYFDLERGAFRSFRLANLIAVH